MIPRSSSSPKAASERPGPFPYFDFLTQELAGGNPYIETAWGRHVHWGYWTDPSTADGSPADFAEATERMTKRLCDLAPVHDGMRILDCGAASAALSQA
jgi:hypothetical protein